MTGLPPAPPLYRLWLKTSGDRKGVEALARREGVLGLGWGIHHRDESPGPASERWEDYIAWAESYWSRRALSSVRILHDTEPDALVWLRSPDGVYSLAKPTAGWQMRTGGDYDRLDLNNLRPARIVEIGTENKVPGAVVRRFSGRGQAYCRVSSPEAARYSALLWARATDTPYDWHPSLHEVLTGLLSPLDVQDLVASYLQVERGWVLLPSRLSASTPAYEFVLHDPQGAQRYAIQVKTGDTPVPFDQLTVDDDLTGWVVYSTTSTDDKEQHDRIEQLQTEALIAFMRARPNALPPLVRAWVDQANDSGSSDAPGSGSGQAR